MPNPETQGTIGCYNPDPNISLFCPELSVTRVQLAFLVLRSKYGRDYSPPENCSENPFADIETEPAHWALDWLCQAKDEGFLDGLEGVDGKLKPAFLVTRAEFAEVLLRALGQETTSWLESAVNQNLIAAFRYRLNPNIEIKRSSVAVALTEAYDFPRFRKPMAVRFNPQGPVDPDVLLKKAWLKFYDDQDVIDAVRISS